jgi:hypothetical protein
MRKLSIAVGKNEIHSGPRRIRTGRSQCAPDDGSRDTGIAGPVRGRIVSRCWPSDGNELSLRRLSAAKRRCEQCLMLGAKRKTYTQFELFRF